MPLVVPSSLPLAILLEFISDLAGTLLVLTGATAGCLRTWAVLTRQSADRIEWLTAFGFALGTVLVILIVIIDLTQELN